ncbi:T7SS effector LXG polymorphic toxin [Bacillus sp. CLL-7-23]|uniref:T7SS effector LXG polymorphic toxin n=1 Tax=Bacillus changyiensis TaxID=3004103 RepID=A0ABT4X2Z5_9BACI|nr:T7SS effector LXG polymorphic toxin [Bacillus changyiensis]MDA7026651.1 T7SS effector LXG polymorphic toxin [Bacillus changyiensis]
MSSNKVFEANSLIDAANKRKKQYENFEEQLQTLKDAFLRMTKLDDFQGKAATNMKNFFSGQAEIVDSWLLLAKERIVFFETISYAVKNKKLEDLYVELSFLSQDLDNADKTADQVVSSLKSEMDGIIDSVRDIIHLDKWTEKNYHGYMSKAQKTRTNTIDAVNELDHSLTTDYLKTKSMEEVVQEKYKGLIDATSNGKSTEPMNFSLKRFHASKVYQTSKALENYATTYIQSKEYQLEVEKEKERIEKQKERIRKLQIKLKSASDDDEFLEIATEIGYDNLTTEQQERFTEIKENKEFWDNPFLGTLNKTGDMIGQGVQNTVEAGKNFAEGSKAVIGNLGEGFKGAAVDAYEIKEKVADTIDNTFDGMIAGLEAARETTKKDLATVDKAAEKHLGVFYPLYQATAAQATAKLDFVVDTSQGVLTLGKFGSNLTFRPIKTANAIYEFPYKKAWDASWDEVKEKWDKNFVHGDLYSRTHYVEYFKLNVVSSFLPGGLPAKGASTATRFGRAGIIAEKGASQFGKAAIKQGIKGAGKTAIKKVAKGTGHAGIAIGNKAVKDLKEVGELLKKGFLKIGDLPNPVARKLLIAEGIPINALNLRQSGHELIQFIKKSFDPHISPKGGKGAKDFEKSLVKLPPAERVATVKLKAQEVAKKAGLVKESKLSKINSRDVYKDPKTGDLFSVDTQHGRFEKTNRKGKHQGEIDFDFKPTKPADTSGGHNLKIK